MQELLERFLKEKRFLQNLTEGSIEYYRQVYLHFINVGVVTFTKDEINNGILKMRERGTSPNAINSYLRGLNTFLRWLASNGHAEVCTIPFLKKEKKILPMLNDEELKAFIKFKPGTGNGKQLHAICLIAMDTGARVDEILSLTRGQVELENFLMTVDGKGQKQRVIPFSFELRKVFYKQLKAVSINSTTS